MKHAMLFQDFERMRDGLTISTAGRVRVILEGEAGKLRIDLECVACEDLLEWDPAHEWWSCPSCQQETTETEMGDLLTACYDGLRQVLGLTDESGPAEVGKGRGIGRWVRVMAETSKKSFSASFGKIAWFLR